MMSALHPTTRIKPRIMPDLSKYLTVKDAAKALNLHPETIRELLRDETLAGIKEGLMWLVSKQSIEDYRKKTEGLDKYDPRRRTQTNETS
jgi:excisionase family DNA binding protein